MTQNEGPSKPIYEVWRNVLVWVFNGVAKCSMDQPQRCRTGLGPNSPSRHQQHEVEGCSMCPMSGDKPSRWRLARTRSCVLLTWRKDAQSCALLTWRKGAHSCALLTWRKGAHSCVLLTWRKDAHWLVLSVHKHLTNVPSPCHCLYMWSHIRLCWPSGGSCPCFFNFALLQLLEARRTAHPHSWGWLLLRAPLSASPTPARPITAGGVSGTTSMSVAGSDAFSGVLTSARCGVTGSVISSVVGMYCTANLFAGCAV